MITVKLNTSKLKKLIVEFPKLADQAVRATAFQVEATAKMGGSYKNVTGSNRASIYSKTSQGAHGSPGNLGDVLPGAGLLTAYVGPSMEYSYYLEAGRFGPYLKPAAAQSNALFSTYIKSLFR